MDFRFAKYDAAELEVCGRAFQRDMQARATELALVNDSAEWTKFVLDWFKKCARLDACVDARPCPVRKTHGEFLLDMTHSDYPPYRDDLDFYSLEYWKLAFERESLELLLALESEWGCESSAELNLARVLEDAAKLAAARARVKVMVCASTAKGTRKNSDRWPDWAGSLVSSLAKLRALAHDDAPWLVLDVPWTPSTEWKIDCALLQREWARAI